MVLYSRIELKHLKWKLMKQEGLNEKQASNRISELLEFSVNLYKKNKKIKKEKKKNDRKK